MFFVKTSDMACCECGKGNITNRFRDNYEDELRETAIEVSTNKIVLKEGQDYSIHFDCYVCLDCGYWDFVDAFVPW